MPTKTLFKNNKHYLLLGGSTGSNSSRFVGHIDGYKEYFEVYDDTVFEEHVLNPGAYHVDNVTGSYYSLYRYFPLGLDVQRWDHTSYTNVSSSQPNRKASFETTASFVGWTGDQTDQYTPLRETFYVYVPSLGGKTLKSNKIRIESSKLLSELNPEVIQAKSAYDKEGFDSNRLAIVFAPNDHVNRDIFNHMGFDELDDWVADPEYEFENEYDDLRTFRDEYYKKYVQKNDINAFIRLLSLYDYTFFEQVKQLAPGRADLITGILIEPHVLERSKVKLSRRPTITNPQWEDTIVYPVTQSGEYRTWDGALSSSVETDMDYLYHTSSIATEFVTEMDYIYRTSSIQQPLNPSGDFVVCYTSSFKTPHKMPIDTPLSMSAYWEVIYTCSVNLKPNIGMDSLHNCLPTESNECVCDPNFTPLTQKYTGHCGAIDVIYIKYSGSASTTSSFIDNQLVDREGIYFRQVYHYSASGDFSSKYERDYYTKVSESLSLYYSRSLEPANYQVDEDSTRNNSRFIGSKISSADFNIDSPNTVDGGPVIEIFESNPNNIFISDDSDEGNLKVE